jgi:hypothetical protein
MSNETAVLGHGMRSEGEQAPVRMWLFPYRTVVTIAGIVAILRADGLRFRTAAGDPAVRSRDRSLTEVG